MIEPVGSVAPSTLAQSLSHTNLTTLGARIAAGFATEFGRARAELAFTRDPSIVASVLAAPARSGEQIDRTGSNARLLATLHAQSSNQSRSPGGRSAVERRGGGPGSQKNGEEPEGGTDSGTEEENDLDALTTRLAHVPIPAIRSGLDNCKAQLVSAGLSGCPVACLFPGNELITDRATDAATADLTVLCLAFDGELGEARHVWGAEYHDAACVATFDARWSYDNDVIEGAAEPWFMSLGMPASMHAVLSCATARARTHGLRVASDAQSISAEPLTWICRRGDVRWA